MITVRALLTCLAMGAFVPAAAAGTQWAVVVGVSEYRILPQDQWLKYAHQDARLFADLLKSRMIGVPPDNIRFLLNQDASTVNIRNAIGAWLIDNSGPEDIVYVYFACHGVVDRRNEAYFITYDTDPERLYASAYPMLELKRILTQIKARHLILVSDSCKSGSIGREQFTGRDLEAPRINDFFKGIIAENAEVAGSEFVLTAAGSFEKSVESEKWGGGHGVFTHYLVEGLRGKADRDGNGRVIANEIYDYVRENVRRDTENKQNPVIASTKFDGNLVLSGVGVKEMTARPAPASPPSSSQPVLSARSPSQESGTLVITSELAGEQVLVDGRPQGTLTASQQLILTVPAGSHTVVAQKEGLEPISYNVTVPAGARVEQKVTRLPAAAGALNDFQNRLMSAQQKLTKKLVEGLKEIESVMDDLFALKQTRSLLPGGQEFVQNVFSSLLDEYSKKKQTAKISSLLTKYLETFSFLPSTLQFERWPEIPKILSNSAAVLQLRVIPAKARIEIDGEYYDSATPESIQMLIVPGSHTLKITSPGYSGIEQAVELLAAETKELSLKLPLPAMNVLVLSETSEVQVLREGGRPIPVQPYAEMETRLAPAQRELALQATRKRGPGPPLYAALLADLPADLKELKLQFVRAKYQTKAAVLPFDDKLRDTIYESRGDFVWDAIVRLDPLLGKLQLSSDPIGADVFVNDEKIGVTPLDVTRGIGDYELTVKQGILRHRESITIKQDETLVLERRLRPPVVFLGIHSRAVGPEKYRDLEERIKSRIGGLFVNSIAEYQNPNKYEFTRDFLLGAVEESQPDLSAVARHLQALKDRFDSALFVFGYLPSERHYLANTLRLYVFSTYSTKPDYREIQFSNLSELDAFFREMDGIQVAGPDLFKPYTGLRTLDADLPGKKLVALQVDAGSPAARAGIERGDSIVKINGETASSTHLLAWVNGQPVGSELRLEIERASGTKSVALKSEPLPALLVTPGFKALLNNLFFQLELLRQRLGKATSLEDDILLLNEALIYLQFEDWKAALEVLNRFAGTAQGAQILSPAVYYYRGLCFERLGDRALARRWFESASREPNPLLRSHLFFDFQTLSTWRLKYLQ